MITHLKPGDLVWCEIPSWDDTENNTKHPCIILKIIEEGVKILPLTNSDVKDVNKIPYDVSLFTCCRALTGFVQIINKQLAVSLCVVDNVCNCELSLKLKTILNLYGVNY